MQFSIILGHFLPQAHGFAALRCNFISQIFYILSIGLLCQILVTMGKDRLDICFMPVCSFMLLSHAAHPSRLPHSRLLYLFYMDVRQPLVPMTTMTTSAELWPSSLLLQLPGHPAGSLPSRHAHCSSSTAVRTSRLPLLCSLQSAALLFFFSFHTTVLVAASSSSSYAAYSQFPQLRLFGLRGSVEI